MSRPRFANAPMALEAEQEGGSLSGSGFRVSGFRGSGFRGLGV